MRNFVKVASGLNVGPIVEQLRDIPFALEEEERFPYPPFPVKFRRKTEWTIDKPAETTAIYDKYNLVLRYTTLGLDPSGFLTLYEGKRKRDEWTRPAMALFTETVLPVVYSIFAAVRGEHIGHIIITHLPPGGLIDVHTDTYAHGEEFNLPYWQRIQVPLDVDPDVIFRCGYDGEDKEEVYMEPGTALWFNSQKPHAVYGGKRPRLSMILEIRFMFPLKGGVQ